MMEQKTNGIGLEWESFRNEAKKIGKGMME